MKVSDIRKKLHQYVDNGDEKLLKLMYELAKEYNDDDDLECVVSEEEVKIFEDRQQKRLTGESRTYSWK